MNKELDEILENADSIIREYEGGEWQSLDVLREMQRELSVSLYLLTKFNIEFYRVYNSILFNNKGSVASGKILADEQVPELRMLRKIMEAIDNVLWSMRSEISIVKKEI